MEIWFFKQLIWFQSQQFPFDLDLFMEPYVHDDHDFSQKTSSFKSLDWDDLDDSS